MTLLCSYVPHTFRGGLAVGAAQAGEPLTMSSREIADLLGARHDNMKRTVDTLVAKGIFVQPQTEDEPGFDSMGRSRPMRVYLLDKRSSLIVVAQLSPEFTARVVDRWQELEAQVASARPVLPDFTNPAIAARAWADEVEKRMLSDQRAEKAEDALAVAAPKAEALDAIADAAGLLRLTTAAKNLGVRPRAVFIAVLLGSKVLYYDSNKDLVPKEYYLRSGYFATKVWTFQNRNREKVVRTGEMTEDQLVLAAAPCPTVVESELGPTIAIRLHYSRGRDPLYDSSRYLLEPLKSPARDT